MEDFHELTGRRFKIIYKDIYDYVYDKKHVEQETKLKKVEGVIENFNPTGEVVISSKNRFTIVLYCTIVQMEEIIKSESIDT